MSLWARIVAAVRRLFAWVWDFMKRWLAPSPLAAILYPLREGVPATPSGAHAFFAGVRAHGRLAGVAAQVASGADAGSVDEWAMAVLRICPWPPASAEAAIARSRALRLFRHLRTAYSLTATLNVATRTPFDHANTAHEQVLRRLWERVQPGGPAATDASSADWGLLGFQGADPATDFRGMGIFALAAMDHCARYYASTVMRVCAATDIPVRGYPWSLTVIQMCAWVVKLQAAHKLDFLYWDLEANTLVGSVLPFVRMSRELRGSVLPTALLLDVIAQLTLGFDDFWYAARPVNIMDFGRIFGAYQAQAEVAFEHNRWPACVTFVPCDRDASQYFGVPALLPSSQPMSAQLGI